MLSLSLKHDAVSASSTRHNRQRQSGGRASGNAATAMSRMCTQVFDTTRQQLRGACECREKTHAGLAATQHTKTAAQATKHTPTPAPLHGRGAAPRTWQKRHCIMQRIAQRRYHNSYWYGCENQTVCITRRNGCSKLVPHLPTLWDPRCASALTSLSTDDIRVRTVNHSTPNVQNKHTAKHKSVMHSSHHWPQHVRQRSQIPHAVRNGPPHV
jgi:hypothetical protein